MDRPLSAIDRIVIHHADTRDGRATTIEEIDAWHAERGFARRDAARARHQPALKSVGYHRVIYGTGVVVAGRALDERGAHVRYSNRNAIGICLVGNGHFTRAQWEALAVEVRALDEQFGGRLQVVGHRQLDAGTVCPGFDVQAWLAGGMLPLDGHIL